VGDEPLHREFGDFYEREAPTLVRTVSLVTGEPALAEDAVAEAFARAWARWGKVRGHDRPAAWVTRVALNQCWSRRRRRQVEQRKRHLVASSEPIHDPDPGDSSLWEAVRQLPRHERVLVALRYVADLPEKEIAETLGLSRGTVASGLHRARHKLAVKLQPAREEEST
jgi:RNA polymerase sigma-70 factor, ECF subfamily